MSNTTLCWNGLSDAGTRARPWLCPPSFTIVESIPFCSWNDDNLLVIACIVGPSRGISRIAFRIGAFGLILPGYKSRKDASIAALSLLCILLVAFTGLVQAVHVHSDNSKLPSHECSICSVAHAGVLVGTVYRPVPLFVRRVAPVLPQVAHSSFGFVSSLRIRPPPAA